MLVKLSRKKNPSPLSATREIGSRRDRRVITKTGFQHKGAAGDAPKISWDSRFADSKGKIVVPSLTKDEQQKVLPKDISSSQQLGIAAPAELSNFTHPGIQWFTRDSTGKIMMPASLDVVPSVKSPPSIDKSTADRVLQTKSVSPTEPVEGFEALGISSNVASQTVNAISEIRATGGDISQAMELAKKLLVSEMRKGGGSIAEALTFSRAISMKQKGLSFRHEGRFDQNWMLKWANWYRYVVAMTLKVWNAASAASPSTSNLVRYQSAKTAWQ